MTNKFVLELFLFILIVLFAIRIRSVSSCASTSTANSPSVTTTTASSTSDFLISAKMRKIYIFLTGTRVFSNFAFWLNLVCKTLGCTACTISQLNLFGGTVTGATPVVPTAGTITTNSNGCSTVVITCTGTTTTSTVEMEVTFVANFLMNFTLLKQKIGFKKRIITFENSSSTISMEQIMAFLMVQVQSWLLWYATQVGNGN